MIFDVTLILVIKERLLLFFAYRWKTFVSRMFFQFSVINIYQILEKYIKLKLCVVKIKMDWGAKLGFRSHFAVLH